MMIKEVKMYYLFSEISKNNFVEAIYVCDDGNYIESATMQTGVYPMGTFLSKTIKMLDPLAKRNFCAPWDMVLSRGMENCSKEDSSFSNLIYNDDATAYKVFDLLLLEREKYVHSRRNEKELAKILQRYWNYIRLCQGKDGEKFSSTKELHFLINQAQDVFPEHSTYVTNMLSKQSIVTESEIENTLSKVNFEDSSFAPPLKEPTQKTFFPRPYSPLRNIKKTKWGELKTPLEVFDITDIIDLILASVYCIFQQRYFLKECLYCKSLFIIRDKRKKYCPNLNDGNKSCFDTSRLERQLEREKSGSAKKEKILRTMSANKYEAKSDEHRKFLSDCQEWRDDIKMGNKTEDEYVKWLDGHFAKKRNTP